MSSGLALSTPLRRFDPREGRAQWRNLAYNPELRSLDCGAPGAFARDDGLPSNPAAQSHPPATPKLCEQAPFEDHHGITHQLYSISINPNAHLAASW